MTVYSSSCRLYRKNSKNMTINLKKDIAEKMDLEIGTDMAVTYDDEKKKLVIKPIR